MEILSTLPNFCERDIYIGFGESWQDGIPFIETNGDSYIYLSYERGRCNEKRETRSLDEALFGVIDGYISSRSYDYERNNRIRYTDIRRLWFERQDMLFSLIGEPYYSMNRKRIDDILERYPYNDHNTRTLDLVKDFEKVAKVLKGSAIVDLKLSNDCRKNIDFFIQKPYRDQYKGIANFKEAFALMLSKYTLIIEEIRQMDILIRALGICDEIRKIDEQIGKVDLDFIIG